MRTGLILFGALALVASSACIAATGAAQAGGARRLSRAVLEDKVRGGWAGQMIGVSYGAATEFKAMGKTFDGEIKWWPEMVKDSLQQDDLYVEMTFAEVMDTVGLDATAKQYGEMFTNSRYQLWHANAGARRLLNHGLSLGGSLGLRGLLGHHGSLFGHHGSLLNGGLYVGRRLAHWEISPRI